jgi:hypothetical protein
VNRACRAQPADEAADDIDPVGERQKNSGSEARPIAELMVTQLTLDYKTTPMSANVLTKNLIQFPADPA